MFAFYKIMFIFATVNRSGEIFSIVNIKEIAPKIIFAYLFARTKFNKLFEGLTYFILVSVRAFNQTILTTNIVKNAENPTDPFKLSNPSNDFEVVNLVNTRLLVQISSLIRKNDVESNQCMIVSGPGGQSLFGGFNKNKQYSKKYK